jgi:hypothetical protein
MTSHGAAAKTSGPRDVWEPDPIEGLSTLLEDHRDLDMGKPNA